MPKFHNSILTYVVSLVSLITAFLFFFISPVQAVCSPTSAGCGTGQYSCSVTRPNGTPARYCCSNQPECTTLKNSASSGSLPGAVQSGALKVNPEGNCSGGIDTALGCIPYDTKGFTAALLGFLAGIVGLIALIVMIIATIMVMTGGSNPEQVKKGKELFTGGVTGLFFIIFSVTILRIIAGDIIQLPGFK